MIEIHSDSLPAAAAIQTRSCAASTRRLLLACATMFAVATLAPPPGHAAVSDVRGSIAVGYAKLFNTGAPGGSLSAGGGISYPLTRTLAVGPSISFHLLGSSTVERGSMVASVDHSVFEAGLLAHWQPKGWGPIALVSAGPEVFSAKADLSTTGGGAAFSDLAVSKTVGAAAANVTLMQSRPSPVRVGLELGGRWAFLSGRPDWKVASARLCFHY
jgi:hypothetical protein